MYESFVYSGVAFSVAAMPNTLDNPVAQISPYKLRIARYQVKRQLCLGSIEVSYEIQQAFADSYALIVRQHHETANAVIMRLHANMSYSDECNGLKLVYSDIASDACAEFAV
jgi:hypothetical protein